MNMPTAKAINPTAAAVLTICRPPSIRTLPTPLLPVVAPCPVPAAEEFAAAPVAAVLVLVVKVVAPFDPDVDVFELPPLT